MNTIDLAAIPPDLWFKASIILIELQLDPDLRAELRELFELRAAVAQYDGGLTKCEAERLAFRELRQTIAIPNDDRTKGGG